MCVWLDITEVQDYDMHYVNAWLKRCFFNLNLNRECVSEPGKLSGRLFQSLYLFQWNLSGRTEFLLHFITKHLRAAHLSLHSHLWFFKTGVISLFTFSKCYGLYFSWLWDTTSGQCLKTLIGMRLFSLLYVLEKLECMISSFLIIVGLLALNLEFCCGARWQDGVYCII